ncbi:MAG TPA: alkaline phosphatase family protein, partial [Devosia sp.]|nr:alkaline phosphatase family protein [Devosia sp.]
RKMGIRSLLDLTSIKDTALVKGTHGRLTDRAEDGPLVISTRPELLPVGAVAATGFKQLVLDHIFN